MSLTRKEWETLRAMINAWPYEGDRIAMHRAINRELEPVHQPDAYRAKCARCGLTGQAHISGDAICSGFVMPDAPSAQRILLLANEIGRHWRDQEGVNGSLLDELAALTVKP